MPLLFLFKVGLSEISSDGMSEPMPPKVVIERNSVSNAVCEVT